MSTNLDLIVAVGRGSAMRLDSLGMSGGLLKEVAIIHQGPTHKWWLSARLLLGMTEAEARAAHEMARLPAAALACLKGGDG